MHGRKKGCDEGFYRESLILEDNFILYLYSEAQLFLHLTWMSLFNVCEPKEIKGNIYCCVKQHRLAQHLFP